MNHHKTIYFLFSICILTFGCKNKTYNNIETPTHSAHVSSNYIGSNQCKSCHEDTYKKWSGSHHDRAMDIANASTVLGNFNNIKQVIDGVSYHFYTKDKAFIVNVTEIDGSVNDYKIAYTFGFTPLQQYLVDFEGGKKQVLRVTWDAVKNKWFHQYKGQTIITTDWLHWTKGAQNWNTMCAECHSTNLKRGYDLQSDTFHTTYSEIDVTCESCHGPGRNHVEWASKDIKDSHSYIINGKTQEDQLSLCAPCHARRTKLTKDLKPGETFENQYLLQSISSTYYHADGQIDEEDYVYGSFLQSKMYAQGVKCNDCHDAHSLKLKFDGNQLCLQCHAPSEYNSPRHHFHNLDTDAALCINCHMTGKIYMGNDFRRDHSFRIPRPDQSAKYGTPNACNQCHQDKSNQWAAQKIKSWYGKERASHFSDALLLSNKLALTTSERQSLNIFINNLEFPAIARATVIENLSYLNQAEFNVLFLALKDPSPLVRYKALLEFRSLTPEMRKTIAVEHLKDSTRLVRIAAAQLVLDINETTFDPKHQSYVYQAKAEYEHMMFTNADFPEGRLQLGDYYMQMNNVSEAIKHYKMSLYKDSLVYPAYSNLATAYSINQNYDEAFTVLNLWEQKQPNLGRPHYLKALLHFELKEDEKAIAQLQTAIRVDPNDTRSMYNLSTYYFQGEKDLSLANDFINKALQIMPNNNDYQYLKALILQKQGKTKAANAIFKMLQVNQ
ncbi:hypothetical protein KFZ70_02320 [Tamlana fucoidanivorans]|uniref:Tetratricopeptide repeat protein n=1 Tax=Allotamlana fucoidanivorans TaxID=2583814 RepID=A0A5C4SGG0_9FLAO|nr:multiheme c-type cytochrome [Tamlana fucoidanivorans]TNJ42516.1 hypothetical protein FGF67_13545 [Tamlana fucoidanivorans]